MTLDKGLVFIGETESKISGHFLTETLDMGVYEVSQLESKIGETMVDMFICLPAFVVLDLITDIASDTRYIHGVEDTGA